MKREEEKEAKCHTKWDIDRKIKRVEKREKIRILRDVKKFESIDRENRERIREREWNSCRCEVLGHRLHTEPSRGMIVGVWEWEGEYERERTVLSGLCGPGVRTGKRVENEKFVWRSENTAKISGVNETSHERVWRCSTVSGGHYTINASSADARLYNIGHEWGTDCQLANTWMNITNILDSFFAWFFILPSRPSA